MKKLVFVIVLLTISVDVVAQDRDNPNEFWEYFDGSGTSFPSSYALIPKGSFSGGVQGYPKEKGKLLGAFIFRTETGVLSLSLMRDVADANFFTENFVIKYGSHNGLNIVDFYIQRQNGSLHKYSAYTYDNEIIWTDNTPGKEFYDLIVNGKREKIKFSVRARYRYYGVWHEYDCNLDLYTMN